MFGWKSVGGLFREGVLIMVDILNFWLMVNLKLLKNYMGRRVMIVVKVVRMEGGNVVGELFDGVLIMVK